MGAWISNHIYSYMCYIITHLCPILNSGLTNLPLNLWWLHPTLLHGCCPSPNRDFGLANLLSWLERGAPVVFKHGIHKSIDVPSIFFDWQLPPAVEDKDSCLFLTETELSPAHSQSSQTKQMSFNRSRGELQDCCFHLRNNKQWTRLMVPFSDVAWSSWHLESQATPLFVQQLILAKNKGNIKALHHWAIQ